MSEPTTSGDRALAEEILRAMAAELNAAGLDIATSGHDAESIDVSIDTQDNGTVVMWTFGKSDSLSRVVEADTLDECYLRTLALLKGE